MEKKFENEFDKIIIQLIKIFSLFCRVYCDIFVFWNILRSGQCLFSNIDFHGSPHGVCLKSSEILDVWFLEVRVFLNDRGINQTRY